MSLLGIDVGSSGCKAVCFRVDGTILSRASRTYETARPVPGHAELDIQSVVKAVFECIRETAAACSDDPVKALAITSLGEACIPVTATGIPALPFCVMPEDSRASKQSDAMRDAFTAEAILRRTGIRPAACYSLPLLARLYSETPGLAENTRWLLSWTDFIAFLLTGKAVCNTSSASRTLAYDVHLNQWIGEYIVFAGLNPAWFPPLVSPGTPMGAVRTNIAAELGLADSVQVFAGCHDQCAAAVGTGAASEEDLMLGLGTYACALFCKKNGTPPQIAYGVPMNIEPHVLPGTYASYIYHVASGGMNRWLRDLAYRDLTQENPYTAMFDEITDWTPRDVPLMLPEFGQSRGVIDGISFGHTRADFLFGAWQSALFFFRQAVAEAAETGVLKRIYITGGCANPQIVQLTADILQLPVIHTDTKEAGALGCAMMAGAGIGAYTSVADAARAIPKPLLTCTPQHDFSRQFARWKQLREAAN